LKAPSFAYAKPSSREEVFDLLERYGDRARILAGGQSLLATLNLRLSAPQILVDITGLPGFASIEIAGDVVRIGALATHAEIARSPAIARYLPMLAQAVRHVGHVAIRNLGTFGGSIALADPAAEYPACALALGATLTIAGRRGERHVAARDFFKGLYETALARDELLIAGLFPATRPPWRSAVIELARRHGDYAIVGVAAHAKVESGRLSEVRLAYFNVGRVPVLARNAAAALEGKSLDEESVAAAQSALADDLDPQADLHASAATKLHLARVLAGRALAALVA
jgi:carbon-monoxide dehydrogenase medium subunit